MRKIFQPLVIALPIAVMCSSVDSKPKASKDVGTDEAVHLMDLRARYRAQVKKRQATPWGKTFNDDPKEKSHTHERKADSSHSNINKSGTDEKN